MRRICHLLLGAVLLSAAASIHAQGRLDRVKGHYVGALDFFNNQPDLKHRVRHPKPADNGLQGDADGWIGDDSVQVRGLMHSAQLKVDWWILFGEPVANYSFVWQSSGQYEIRYNDPKKGRITATVTREKLKVSEHLLKRFDGLKPVETNFEIRWRIGDQSSRDRETFKQRYRLFGSIGGAAPHVKTNMITRLHDGMLIYEPSGITPFSSPTSPPGGWKTFGSLSDSFDSMKIKMLSDYFQISIGQVVQSFRATKFRWPLGEMKAIAEALTRIESGEALSPVEQVREAGEEHLSDYTAKDEWADAIPPPVIPTPTELRYDKETRLMTYHLPDGRMAFPEQFTHGYPFIDGVAIVGSREVNGYTLISTSGQHLLDRGYWRITALGRTGLYEGYNLNHDDRLEWHDAHLWDPLNRKNFTAGKKFNSFNLQKEPPAPDGSIGIEGWLCVSVGEPFWKQNSDRSWAFHSEVRWRVTYFRWQPESRTLTEVRTVDDPPIIKWSKLFFTTKYMNRMYREKPNP